MIVYFTHIHKNSCKILIVQLNFDFFCTDNEIFTMLHPIVSMLGIIFIQIFEGHNFRRLSKSRIFMALFSRIICHQSLCYIIMHFDCFINSRI